MPRPSVMTKKILPAGSPVASLMTRSRPAERARFCSSERPYRMSQEIIDIGILLSWRECLLNSRMECRMDSLGSNFPKKTQQINDGPLVDFHDCFDDVV